MPDSGAAPQHKQGSLASMDTFVAGDPHRGLGAITVVLAHLGLTVVGFSGGLAGLSASEAFEDRFGLGGGLFMLGGIGFVVFLMLSGYLIGRPFVRAYIAGAPLPGVKPYALNRVLRIVPAFWFVVTLHLILLRPAGETLPDTASVYFFVQNYHLGPLGNQIQHAWSIDAEVAFYALLPLAALAMAWLTPARTTRQTRLALVLGLAGAALVASSAFRNSLTQDLATSRTLPAVLCFFAPGILLAAIEPFAVPRLAGTRTARVLARALAVCAVAGLLLWFFGQNGRTFGEAALANVAIVTAFAAMAAPMVLQWGGAPAWRLFENRALHWLGKRSYSFYLLHMLPILLLDQEFVSLAQRSPWGMLAVLVAIEVVVLLPLAHLSYRFIECPFLAMKRPRQPGSLKPLAPAPGAGLAARAK